MLQNFKQLFAQSEPKSPRSSTSAAIATTAAATSLIATTTAASKRLFSTAPQQSYPLKASCEVGANGNVCAHGPEQAPSCHGIINFKQESESSNVDIDWDLKQCGAEGKHGFHIHEFADFSNGCLSAGPHFNPYNTLHGAPEDDDHDRHVGDLGNILMDSDGNCKGGISDRMIKLNKDSKCCIIGRSVMVHADEDDLGKGDNTKMGEEGPPANGYVSRVTGNAGARIACGEIKLVE